MRGYWDSKASLADQLLTASMSGDPFATNIDYQELSVLRFSSMAVSFEVPPQLLRKLGARSAQLQFSGSNLGLWSRYRGQDPGVNSTPIGERTTDNGISIGQPRSYMLQLRVGY